MEITKIIEENKNAIILVDVHIPAEHNQQKVSIKGTGFIVAPEGKFITNAHVYKAIPENEWQYMGVSVPGKTDEKNLLHYDRYPIKLINIDEQNDVAYMEIISDKKDFQTVKGLGDSEKVKEGDDIIFIGYPLAVELLNMGFGITMTTNQSIISSVKRKIEGGMLSFFLTDSHINSGSSGSPVFSTKNGEVIGIASAKISAKIPLPGGQVADIPANMGICRPINYAIELINKVD